MVTNLDNNFQNKAVIYKTTRLQNITMFKYPLWFLFIDSVKMINMQFNHFSYDEIWIRKRCHFW